jgi:hypothetical protein
MPSGSTVLPSFLVAYVDQAVPAGAPEGMVPELAGGVPRLGPRMRPAGDPLRGQIPARLALPGRYLIRRGCPRRNQLADPGNGRTNHGCTTRG